MKLYVLGHNDTFYSASLSSGRPLLTTHLEQAHFYVEDELEVAKKLATSMNFNVFELEFELKSITER